MSTTKNSVNKVESKIDVIKNVDSKDTVVKTEKKPKAKLTAAYVKEMVQKGLSPLTGKPIRKYSRTGKRYVGKTEVVAKVAKNIETEASVSSKDTDVTTIPTLNAKKTTKKA